MAIWEAEGAEALNVLVLNSGSSSIKFQVYDAAANRVRARGLVERIGFDDALLECLTPIGVYSRRGAIEDHSVALELVVAALADRSLGVLDDLAEIAAVGHRAVHGGDLFTSSVLVDDEVIQKMEQCVPLAPLHNPSNLAGIHEIARLLPGVPQVAVFDTAFHVNMPRQAYLYALPLQYYTEHKIRRYGFHGTSYRYIMSRIDSLLGREARESRVIVAHLGNGASIAAIKNGTSIDTSMGMTPLEGLVMGTRSGDVDAGVIFHLHDELGYKVDEIDTLLNKESGLLGLSGLSSDVRQILEAAEGGDARCQTALEIYAYRAKKYVGAYAAALGGLDALIFTGGVGENSSLLREMICEDMEFLGIRVDSAQNDLAVGREWEISAAGSTVHVLVVPTNEERMIVVDTLEAAGLLDGVALPLLTP